MNQGKIIEYIDHGKIVCTLCLQDKGNKLHLLTPLNRQVSLPINRVLFFPKSTINPLSPREELINRLRQTEETRNQLKNEVRVHELWELIQDEHERFGYEYLAQLCFGETVTDDQISALIRALFNDKLYFKMKDGAFIPNSEDRVEKIRKEQEEDARKEQALNNGSVWLKQALLQKQLLTEFNKEVMDILEELALHGKEAPRFKYGKELLQRAGITDFRKTRHILIKLGVWEEDEPIDIYRLGIRTSFNEKLSQESNRLANIEISFQGYEDLRHLECFTIDGPWTKDFDDALSMDVQGDYNQLGIHIADVAGIITPGSLIDEEATLRGSSLYLPRRQIPMLPFHLSQDKLSLRKGVDRPAISLIARFNKQGNLFDYRFTLSLINVKRQLTYDQVNDRLMNEAPFDQINHLCDQMRHRRIDDGALILSLPETSIEVSDDKAISIEMISQETLSRKIVAECMILYNWLAAKLCRDNNIPILYRAQNEPTERIPIDDKDHIYYVFRQRRKLHPLIIGTKSKPHTGLGLDCYTNLTSPIRRYFDLVTQHQIRSFLLNYSFPFNNEELEQIRIRTMATLKDLNIIKKNRIRYWILKYFQSNLGKPLQAIILDTLKTKYRVILKDLLFVAEMKKKEGFDVSPGDEVMVQIKKSEPWDDVLKLDFMD